MKICRHNQIGLMIFSNSGSGFGHNVKMADVDRAAVQAAVKEQGEIVRKLKAEKADKEKVGNCIYLNVYFPLSPLWFVSKLRKKTRERPHICHCDCQGHGPALWQTLVGFGVASASSMRIPRNTYMSSCCHSSFQAHIDSVISHDRLGSTLHELSYNKI